MSDAILDISGVSKAFPNVRALTDLSLSVERGEVVAFVGENGAGKSTLLKILGGDYRADSGTVTLDGNDISHVDPLHARRAGFRLVRQEPEIIPHVTAAENIFAGELPRHGSVVDFAAMRRDAVALFASGGFTGLLSPDAIAPKRCRPGPRLRPRTDPVTAATACTPRIAFTKDTS